MDNFSESIIKDIATPLDPIIISDFSKWLTTKEAQTDYRELAALTKKQLQALMLLFYWFIDSNGQEQRELDELKGTLEKTRERELLKKTIALNLSGYQIEKLSGILNSLRDSKSGNAKKAADARHNKPGGSRDLKSQIQTIWASGKYSSRDVCAEEEWRGLGFGSFKAARNALIRTPNPMR